MFKSLSECAMRIASPRRCLNVQFKQTRYLKRQQETGRHGNRQSKLPIRQKGDTVRSKFNNGHSDKSKYMLKYYGVETDSSPRFKEHLSKYEARMGIRSGKLVEGHLKVSRKNANIAFVVPTNGSPDIFIPNSLINKNRALNGDLVAVELVEDKTKSANVADTVPTDQEEDWICPVPGMDPVSALNDYGQTKKTPASFKSTKSSVTAFVGERELGYAQGSDLKLVKKKAACIALEKLQEEGLLQTVYGELSGTRAPTYGKENWINPLPGKDPQSVLLEYAQFWKEMVNYTSKKTGSEHYPNFSLRVSIGDREFGPADASSVKIAKKAVACLALSKLQEEGLLQKVFPAAKPSSRSIIDSTHDDVADDIEEGKSSEEGNEEKQLVSHRKSRQGKVVSIIKMKHPRVCTGYIDLESVKKYPDGKIFFHTKDESLPHLTISANDLPKDIFTNPEDYSKTLYAAKLLDWSVDHSAADGKLLKCLGYGGEIEAETNGILIEYEVDTNEFSQQVLDCLPKQKNWRIPRIELENRRDLRSSCIFTIDPSTARDIDDALSCEDLGNGLYKVGVHIADVSHFVLPDTALDIMASQRSTSHYLVQKAIPMLPSLLSEELCSLNPNVERLAFSVEWTITEKGEVVSEWFGRSVIKSCVKLSYDQAQGFINNPEKEWSASDLPSISKPFGPSDVAARVLNLHKLAVQLRGRRNKSGTLRLDKMVLDFRLDPDTQLPNGCYVYEHKDSNKLIEEFMLLANMSVARVIKRKFPDKAVLRRHEPPKQSMLIELRERCEKYGINIDISSAGSIQKSLDKLYGEDEESQSRLQVLVAMCTKTIMLAKYFCAGTLADDSDFVHYALNVPLYTHFTSPIRRYPDILVHRLLGAALGYNKVPSKSIDQLEKILEHANVRKEASKRVGDKSADLFFAAFLKTVGPIEEKAIVMAIAKKSFEIFVLRFGVSKTISFKDLPAHKFVKDKDIVFIDWPEEGKSNSRGQNAISQTIKQKIELFTMLNCVLQVPEDQPGLKWKATILKPPDGRPSDQTGECTGISSTNTSNNSSNDFTDYSSDSESSDSDNDR